ncbi:MAG: glycosyltransferase family 4 protein [Vicinamibacterales bacterium]
MRVAILNWTSRHVGGAETYVSHVAQALADRQHEIMLCHEQDGPADRAPMSGMDRFVSCSIQTRGPEAARNALAAWGPDVLLDHGFVDPEQARRLQDLAPSVFVAHAYYGTCISGSKTVRVPVTQPCARRFGPMCLVNFFPRRCGGLSPVTMARDYRTQSARLRNIRRSTFVVTLSEHMRMEYLKHGFDASRVVHLPPIGDAPLAGGSAARAMVEQKVGGRARQLAYIGRVERLKGCRELLAALPAVAAAADAEIELTIAGDGSDLPRCRLLWAELSRSIPRTRVSFLGWSSQATCDRLLSGTDVFVMPSLWPEPFGLTGAEAVRRGVPVAAFRVGAVPEWLADGVNGALAPGNPPTVHGLADAIVRCLRMGGTAVRSSEPSGSPHLDQLIAVLGAAAAGRHSLTLGAPA